jgi:tRNA pseudouridine38-40 synthase
MNESPESTTPSPVSTSPRLPSIRGTRRDDLALGHRRFICKVAYDGTAFCGWQSQTGGHTVQDAIEKRLAHILLAPARIHGSGRTDAGVHAIGQVLHFDAKWKHSTDTLLRALRTGLPSGIQISEVKEGRPNFHARFSVKGKRYCYHIYEGYAPPMQVRYCHSTGEQKLNVPAMKEAAAMLLGIHDFTAFGGQKSHEENPVKDLRRLDVIRRGPHIDVITESSGYLYKMVRRLAGGLMQVGSGRMTPQELFAYLEAKKSLAAVPSAPAKGLVMEKVFYRLPSNADPVFRRKPKKSS